MHRLLFLFFSVNLVLPSLNASHEMPEDLSGRRFEVRLMTSEDDLKILPFFKIREASLRDSASSPVSAADALTDPHKFFTTFDRKQVDITEIGDFWGQAIPDRKNPLPGSHFRWRHMLFGGFWVELEKNDFLSTVVEVWGRAPCENEDLFNPKDHRLTFSEISFRHAYVAINEPDKTRLEETCRHIFEFLKPMMQDDPITDTKDLEENGRSNLPSDGNSLQTLQKFIESLFSFKGD